MKKEFDISKLPKKVFNYIQWLEMKLSESQKFIEESQGTIPSTISFLGPRADGVLGGDFFLPRHSTIRFFLEEIPKVESNRIPRYTIEATVVNHELHLYSSGGELHILPRAANCVYLKILR